MMFDENSTIVTSSGMYRVVKLMDGRFCAVHFNFPELELQRLKRLDAATLLEHQCEGVLEANVVVYEACSFKHEREQEQGPPVLQAELEREGIEQEQGPPVLQAELEREGIGESDAVYVTGVSCSVLNTPPIDRRCFADAVDEMEDEDEGPHEWWDEQEQEPPVLQAELEREGIEQEAGPSGSRVESISNEPGMHYYGLPDTSKYGRHPVLIYKIPGRPLCYTFIWKKTNRNSQSFNCLGCKKERKFTGTTVVNSIEFTRDPCLLNHVCLPFKWPMERSKRIFYGQCQEWRGDEKYLNYDPYREHGRFLLDVEKSTTIANEEKEATLSHYSDYGKCRVTVYRNLRHHMEREVSMEYVPDHLALNPDGTRFLQYQTADMHIYYSEKIIRKACENGLDTLIADGIFSMHPNQREKNGQLYTIHGVCNGKVNVPLLYAITNKKTEFIYTKIWTMLKEVIDSTTDHDFNPRILLDFERASIKAAKRVFPGGTVEGCAFHLARSWNRKRDELGLRKFLKGNERSRRVTWFDGPFAGMWNKWDKDILRTTNIAESYHSTLTRVMKNRRPPLRDLLEYLHGLNARSFGLLLHHEEYPAAEIRLRPKDLHRREKVRREMDRFRSRLSDPALTDRSIKRYCKRMSSQDVPRNRDISSYTLSDVLKGFALMNKVLKIQDA
ncbi:unnamed protein product [Heligmosomoides polygyrus]|uniref:MULE domain-containing protein n=1 Tax=Heligmosomoides polygyrus TaxID=6339 RepID=A0A183FRH0_HELPZ|nr:unnamed protein product [Heligmosomoides polygyrus]